MEVVIAADADAAADSGRRRDRACARHASGAGARPGDRKLAARRLPATDRRLRAGELSFAHASAVLLDEYVGLPVDHPEAYRAFIRRELVDHVDLPHERLFGPDVHADDLADACRHYDQLIADLGGVDVQLLGIGSDGHVGFNEPGSSLASRTADQDAHTRDPCRQRPLLRGPASRRCRAMS